MRRLRAKHHRRFTDNPETGQQRPLEEQSKVHVLADDGSIDTHSAERAIPCDCGCFFEVGGRCSICGAISCVRCHHHCEGGCNRALCIEHSYKYIDKDKQEGRVCRRCGRRLLRRRGWLAVGKTLLLPFITFEKK